MAVVVAAPSLASPCGSFQGGSSLAADVLMLSGLLAQGGLAKEGAPYTFPLDSGSGAGEGEFFELGRDDTLDLIGLLNSQELDIAKREFGVLLARLPRNAVEGLTQRLVLALQRQKRELAGCQQEIHKGAGKVHLGKRQVAASPGAARRNRVGRDPDGTSSPGRPPMNQGQQQPRQQARSSNERPKAAASRRPASGAFSPPRPPAKHFEPEKCGPSDTSGDEELLPASAYLQALIQSHGPESECAGQGSSQSCADLDPDWPMSKPPLRVTEEKAKEIFDRLYKSGKDHRVRRRVYHELGLLVDQAKHDQTCTFVPYVPFAGQPGGGSVTERLYRDGMDRHRRREELWQSAPTPTFHPRIFASSASLAASTSAVPESTQDICEGIGESVEEETSYESRHVRLFREHEERRTRQSRREVHGAEWLKHSFRPNIASSQASGPQVHRLYSGVGPYDHCTVGTRPDTRDGYDYPVHHDFGRMPQPPVSSPSMSSLAAVAVAATTGTTPIIGGTAPSSAMVPKSVSRDAQEERPGATEQERLAEEEERLACDAELHEDLSREGSLGLPSHSFSHASPVTEDEVPRHLIATCPAAIGQIPLQQAFAGDSSPPHPCVARMLSAGQENLVPVARMPSPGSRGRRTPEVPSESLNLGRTVSPGSVGRRISEPGGDHNNSGSLSPVSPELARMHSGKMAVGLAAHPAAHPTVVTAHPQSVMLDSDGNMYATCVKPPGHEQCHTVSREVSAATYHSSVCLTPMMPGSPGSPVRAFSERVTPDSSAPLVITVSPARSPIAGVGRLPKMQLSETSVSIFPRNSAVVPSETIGSASIPPMSYVCCGMSDRGNGQASKTNLLDNTSATIITDPAAVGSVVSTSPSFPRPPIGILQQTVPARATLSRAVSQAHTPGVPHVQIIPLSTGQAHVAQSPGAAPLPQQAYVVRPRPSHGNAAVPVVRSHSLNAGSGAVPQTVVLTSPRTVSHVVNSSVAAPRATVSVAPVPSAASARVVPLSARGR